MKLNLSRCQFVPQKCVGLDKVTQGQIFSKQFCFLFCMSPENLDPIGIQTLDRPVSSNSLYRLRHASYSFTIVFD